LFPRATVWIQKDEYDYYVGPQGEVLHTGGADADDAKMLAELNKSGRVRLVDGDAKEILPGITVYTGGKHTFASQFAGVRTAAGTVVLASDNAYLYENLEKHLPIAQTLDAESNLKAQERMLALAAAPSLVIPGHDPAVFERFPAVAPGVVKISK
jgi:glyoxylase-like metal-dependent hydrolase (beta-lactamase superfamily II)